MKKCILIFTLCLTGQLNAAIIHDFVGPYKASNWEFWPPDGFNALTATHFYTSKHAIGFDVINTNTFDSNNPTVGWFGGLATFSTVAKGSGIASFDIIAGHIMSPAGTSGDSNISIMAFAGDISTGSNIQLICSSVDFGCGTIPVDPIEIPISTGEEFGLMFLIGNMAPGFVLGVELRNFSAPVSIAVSEPHILSLIVVSLMLLASFGNFRIKINL
ncbi:hypothetical protein [Nitrosomonas marina]|uniref:PEP-CTERM protein-sorting domain-containing protein n=1 Tax=Nitrosomonas marina TaxID=917 RepID=A0A1H8FFE8_9PROT|nr:hypothetical protein [Nitrosomonas marina]SEN30330.1 hypothetical protein SAMN05216325_11310 [Nitrosomonas marina]